MKTRRGAAPAIAAATLAVSFSAIFIHWAAAPFTAVVALRMGMAAVILAPVAARHGDREAIRCGAVSGVLLSVHFLAWTASLALTSVAASVLLVCLHPLIVTPLSSRFGGDVVTPRVWTGVGLATGGAVITCAGDLRVSGTALAGDGLALLGAVALAGYLLIGRRSAQRGVTAYSASAYGVVAVIAAMGAVAHGDTHVSAAELEACAALAIVCTIGGHTVFNWALRDAGAATVSVAFLGEPPLSALLALLLLGQRPAIATVVGGAVILAGLAITLQSTSRNAPAPVAPV